MQGISGLIILEKAKVVIHEHLSTITSISKTVVVKLESTVDAVVVASLVLNNWDQVISC